MGANLSFPILCSTSLLILLETHGDLDHALSLNTKDFETYVTEYNKGGWNGDDIIIPTKGGRDVGQRWNAVVTALNGVAELSKSPMNPRFGTVNSRLFFFGANGRFSAVPTIHPGKLVHLLGGSPGAPDRHWLDLIKAPPYIRHELFVDFVMKPGVPTQLGGTGLKLSDEVSHADVEQYIYALYMTEKPKTTELRTFGKEESEPTEAMKVQGTVAVDRKHYLSWRAERHRSKKSYQWRDPLPQSHINERLERLGMAFDRLSWDGGFFKSCKRKLLQYRAAEAEGKMILTDCSLPFNLPYQDAKTLGVHSKEEKKIEKMKKKRKEVMHKERIHRLKEGIEKETIIEDKTSFVCLPSEFDLHSHGAVLDWDVDESEYVRLSLERIRQENELGSKVDLYGEPIVDERDSAFVRAAHLRWQLSEGDGASRVGENSRSSGVEDLIQRFKRQTVDTDVLAAKAAETLEKAKKIEEGEEIRKIGLLMKPKKNRPVCVRLPESRD